MSVQLSRFTPRHRVFKASYLVVALLAGVVGYQTVHYSSAQSLPANNVELQMSKPSYVLGEVVYFTISNNLKDAVYVANNCPNAPLTVFKQEQNSWMPIHATVANTDKCLNEPRSYMINPGGQISTSYIFWPTLFKTPGHYRIVAPIEGFANGPSAEFDITSN